ncbi:MAG: DUF1214 domain-containing protein [Bacteroidota bacterium]|nr:DUF1214 domain-containing protein [Bacteroidota bacterium]
MDKVIKWKSENRGKIVNNWRVSLRTGNYGNNYLLRAAIAVHSLGNAIPEEAMFFHGFFDKNGDKLNGNNNYTFTFEKSKLPPVDAFWSLTLYSEDGYLVDNKYNRYSLSDRTDGLKYNSDSSLTIYIQHEKPVDSLFSNWLYSPLAEFTLTMRAYLPKKELFDLKWEIPPVLKAKN